MPGQDVDVSTGLTVAFATSAFSAELLDVSLGGIARAAIETSHMGTAAAGASEFGNKTFIPGRLVDGGEYTLETHFNPQTLPIIGAAAEVITVTFPKAPGDTTAANYAFTGFVTAIDKALPLDDKMTASITVKVTGGQVLTPAT